MFIFFQLLLCVVYGRRQFRSSYTKYQQMSYGDIVTRIEALKGAYPKWIKVTTAQEAYGVSDELTCSDSPFVKNAATCLNYILQITNFATLPDPERPQVFFSGALHGNERVGPVAVIELATFLLDHVSRNDGHEWIKRLVHTRDIYIMPMANAHGYFNHAREENGIDPNRDFPYLQSGKQCMQTLAARSLNELWKRQLFQLAITFHGGMRAVSYEWGSTNHYASGNGWDKKGEKSPDHTGQQAMASSMAKFGGAFDDGQFYPVGTMNDVVYGVEGGMEDWGYASSWENDVTPAGKPLPISTCQPETFGGYSQEKTEYNKATHRAYNILVETSNDKDPNSLGTNQGLLDDTLLSYFDKNQAVGHIARNIRMCLLYLDLVQPYLMWTSNTSSVMQIEETRKVQWKVYGAITVDQTVLEVSMNESFELLNKNYKIQKGTAQWHPSRHEDRTATSSIFIETISFNKPGIYYIRARAIVDQNWANQGLGNDTPSPNVIPRSHVVNARTNSEWKYENNGYVVIGSRDWYSSVLKIMVMS